MKFTQHYTVKWHDTDANRMIRPTALFMYMQETANEHLAKEAISLDALRDEQGLAFLLSSISVVMYEPLYARDEIAVQTWVTESRGLKHNRCFAVLRGSCVVAEAFSVWALMDLREKRLLRSGEEPYHLEPEQAVILPLPKRFHVPAPESMGLVGKRRIVYSDIDYNGHMNNTHYPDLFCDFLPDACSCRVTGMMLSFLHEAAFGHTLDVWRARTDDGFLFRLTDENGTVCTDALVQTVPFEGIKKA